MALSYDDMMFECIFDNTEDSKLTQKKSKKSIKSKSIKSIQTKTSKTLKTSIKISENITFYDYDYKKKINYHSLQKIYKNYEYIVKYFNYYITIINNSNEHNLSNNEKIEYQQHSIFLLV